ncbi:hypothetical protein GWK47_022655 [Chionoecetes opilio]|uniref:Uncharacterized protein n=1 Tax=Chionoecetes opilio TaxID=41210 RepID=A0A8J4XMW1_CHIOP|nr:hypothetical protein GWK47_022655 [Chionoecetes opilio]
MLRSSRQPLSLCRHRQRRLHIERRQEERISNNICDPQLTLNSAENESSKQPLRLRKRRRRRRRRKKEEEEEEEDDEDEEDEDEEEEKKKEEEEEEEEIDEHADRLMKSI